MQISYELVPWVEKCKTKSKKFGSQLPFHVDVTHVFSSDAGFVQSDISCVPDDGSQEVPVLRISLCFIPKCIMMKYYIFECLLLLGFAWSNITRRPWQTEALGENVDPHLNFSLHSRKGWFLIKSFTQRQQKVQVSAIL